MAGTAARPVLSVALAAGLAGCGGLAPSASPSDAGLLVVRVHVADPAVPGVDMELQIGTEAWSVVPVEDTAVAIVHGDEPQPVRLYAVGDCRLLLAFDAEPDASYGITFDAEGEASVDGGPLAPGTAVAMGPGLVPLPSPTCRSG